MTVKRKFTVLVPLVLALIGSAVVAAAAIGTRNKGLASAA